MKAVAGVAVLAGKQYVAAFAAEVRDVDDGEWICGLDPELGTGLHGRKPPPRLQDRQRAFQPLEIVDRVGLSHFCQNFQNGFLGSSAAGAAGGRASGLACGTGTFAACATSVAFAAG